MENYFINYKTQKGTHKVSFLGLRAIQQKQVTKLPKLYGIVQGQSAI